MGLMKELNDLNNIYQKMYEGKKADKDYDGDGKVESGSKEHAGVVHNAIQKKKGGKADGKDTRSEAMIVTNADKKANTKAYQNFKKGMKNKKGEPVYKAADHLKSEGYETTKKKEVLSAMDKQGRKLSKKDKEKIANKVVKDKGDTSKSDDRYAYEDFQPSENVSKLVESGKFTKEEIWGIYEADTYAAQLARFEAGRQKRMKASGTYERPKWIPKDQDHSDDYGSSKGKKTTKEGYQRNPEKGEAEERKAERDRKASGRMPPRGDKRREEFERWYAANVR